MENLKKKFSMAGFSDSSVSSLCNYFKKKVYKKNEYLLAPGRIAKRIYFIETGSVILGHMTDRKAVTRHLALSSEFITCLASFQNQIATDEYLKATERTEAYEISKDGFKEASKQFPAVQDLYQKLVFELLVKCQQRITDLISQDAHSYYEYLSNTNPDIVQNMHQYDLASYMGIEPQSLSRLRAKKPNK
ncbi:Crp/Fnr family transcriptional regulator [Parapedobacter sp. DT-150]|uniref:Crp/Fnr family transcriptional regulator n=1 Tax=Parapedobacter sp. DT-150 TaxID=3396162 RepID=UPI003F1CE2C7